MGELIEIKGNADLRLASIKEWILDNFDPNHLELHQNDDYYGHKDAFKAGKDKGFALALDQILSMIED